MCLEAVPRYQMVVKHHTEFYKLASEVSNYVDNDDNLDRI